MANSETQQLSANTVSAYPTKGFFVRMLTRDIDLVDAILDLVDNCIDGVHRSLGKQEETVSEKNASPYSGFQAEITIDKDMFRIKDNCGGISLKTAIGSAFRMGRDIDNHDDDDLETVGMYGIGMKRAIFKMGSSAQVLTWHKNERFQVSIPESWMTEEARDNWTFNYELLHPEQIEDQLQVPGTIIHVSSLYPIISKQFSDSSGFLIDLANALKNHYGYIIKKGFTITLNGVKIVPIEISLLTTSNDDSISSIQPFVYNGRVGDVEITLAIGFYRPPPSEDEINLEMEGKWAEASSENAGITVLCNERVVLYCDKTEITGWGDPPVPKYHTQFIAIAGIVHFKSKEAYQLPVTTTKRNLDRSSPVYTSVRSIIREGLRIFTQFTNNWKSKSSERDLLFAKTTAIPILAPNQSTSLNFTLSPKKPNEEGKYHIPTLPMPNDGFKRDNVSITFTKERSKVEAMGRYFFNNPKKSASDIGSFSFDEQYAKVED